MKLCSIDGCDKPHKAFGLCRLHNSRRKRREKGIPERTSSDELTLFFETAQLSTELQECIIWPFDRDQHGYAKWKKALGRFSRFVTRSMCFEIHGLPLPKQHAAHSCGRGRDGCINPNHLTWKSAKENMADKKMHGTEVFGEKIPWSKFTEQDIFEIHRLLETHTEKEVAEIYSVRRTNIHLIAIGRNWNRVKVAVDKLKGERCASVSKSRLD